MKPATKSPRSRIHRWTFIEDAIIGYLSQEQRPNRCELGDFIHDCGLLRDRTNSGIQKRFHLLQKESALLKLPRWTQRQTERVVEEWGDRAYTMAVARDVIEALGTTVMPHPPEAVLCRVAALHCRLRHEQPIPKKDAPHADGRSLVRFLRSPNHFDWLDLGERRQALLLAMQGGAAVFRYLELCQTPLHSPCKK